VDVVGVVDSDERGLVLVVDQGDAGGAVRLVADDQVERFDA